MKILLNRCPVYDQAWGGGNNFVKAFCELAVGLGHKVVHKFSNDIDCILVLDPRYSDLGISLAEIVNYKININPKVKIVHRINECDARKGTGDIDALLRECSKFSDVSIFVSKWIQQYHNDRNWKCNTQFVVYNGVDKNVFFERHKKNNRKINIVTHHWSDNFFKGFDIYELLDKFVGENTDFTFTYIGRERGTFKNAIVINPLYGKSLGDELGQYDVYVSASRFEPGPNHVLESIACGIPTYVYKTGGAAIEMAGNDHVFDSFDCLRNILLLRSCYSKNKLTVDGWDCCVSNYLDIIGAVVRG